MLADDAAGAQGGEADPAGFPHPGDAVVRRGADVGQIDVAAVGGGLAQHQGGAGWRISLPAVMGLQNLDVPVGRIEPLCRVFHQPDQYVDSQREISAADDGDLFGRLVDFGLLFSRESGRADDQGRTAAFGAGPGQLDRGVRGREVDDHVAQRQVGHFAPVETGRDDHVLARVQNGRNRPAHTAAGSRDAGVKDGAQFGPLSVPGHSGAIRRCRHPRLGRPYCGVSEPRMSAQKRLALPVKDEFLGVWLSPSEAASS